ncbi:DUF4260 domain-containing protein [Jannaschia seohaensis]|uniref:Uncharacterized protein DUF4260 n=1 Tax=Jannaschia seohaensis TaxID=475081 RepID=A0A2Y9AQA3_9RHOB|nr:DUF4260 domain-containing protein [Jannaschia seohaensis]PWJ18136.1 uncharacterized protein DUF4260 [Jannaschia seohaensis]SSA46661.1 protein of unknown function [Jannaschia seohaensis]
MHSSPAVTGTPARLLRLEGAAVAALSVAIYATSDAPWWLFAACLLLPDVAMIGYLGGPGPGARLYNAAHTYLGPVLLAAIGLWSQIDLALALAYIWGTHIGIDRTAGYGLKYPQGFRATHLAQSDAPPVKALPRA